MTDIKTVVICFLWVALVAIIGIIIASKTPDK
jgi:hypothetical protein